jgi:xylulokinase
MLVAGVDSSTQATKVVVRDGASGALVRQGRAPHPPGSEVAPEAWWQALGAATEGGLLDDVDAIGVAGQQHGLVVLDDEGEVVRPALLWNDTRSAGAADDLVEELGGGGAWAEAVGTVPVASITVTKLRWLAEHEPDRASRVSHVLLPHDHLTWRLTGRAAPPVTDRGDASGTGYWSPSTGRYRPDLLRLAFGRELQVPVVLGPSDVAGTTEAGAVVSAGTGDNMAAALGVGPGPATSSCPSGRAGPSSPCTSVRAPTRPGPSPASPTPPAATSRWSAR